MVCTVDMEGGQLAYDKHALLMLKGSSLVYNGKMGGFSWVMCGSNKE